MEFIEYKTLVNSIPYGKRLPDAIYIHESAIDTLPKQLGAHFARILIDLDLADEDWNILKFFKRDHKVSLLYYPGFFEDAYPALHTSYTVNFEKRTYRTAHYSNSDNPPILHRKETFIKPEHPSFNEFMSITVEGKEIGLYEKPKLIGFKRNWERLIKSKGYYLNKEGRLNPLINLPISDNSNLNHICKVERHKTAIDRNHLSQPMQALARHNYLNGEYSVLDYGCGKGDDVIELEAHGIDVIGWDPTHRSNVECTIKDIVNLGFVLNVIEDRQERTETLINAWRHTDKILVVAVMVAGENIISQFTPYRDGVITSINTFQKYYSQAEIRYYIETSLGETAITVGRGIFLIFKDKLEEQLFLSERQHIKRDWKQKTQRQLALKPKTIRKDVIDKHIELFTDYWETTLELGRIPANDEFEYSDQIRRVVGSHIKAHNALLKYFGEELFNEAQEKRKEDLLVYFSLGLFGKRKPQTRMPEALRRDIKVFFKSVTSALNIAKTLLFSVGNSHVIEEACVEAYKHLVSGHMQQGHSYTFHISHLGDIPAALRVYIGCATQLYGDMEDVHLIKAHFTSGKVSLMRYDDWDKDKPLLLERIKIKLRELDVDYFDYGYKFAPTPLVNKNIYYTNQMTTGDK